MPKYERGGEWFTIEVDGVYLVIAGRDGRDVQAFDSEDDAEGAYDDRVFAALEKGYRLVAPGAPPVHDLERSIVERPDDHQAHLVYADLLMGEGDPRGELIAAHVELERKPNDRVIARRAKAILDDHADVLIGDLEPLIELGVDVHWRLGFIDRAEVDLPFDADESSAGEAAILSTLLGHPSVRHLRDLRVTRARISEEQEPALDPLVEAIVRDAPETLWTLWLRAGRDAALENGDLAFNIPGLRSLRLRVEELHAASIDAPSLETLVVEDFLSTAVLRAIAAAQWPRLAKLDLWLDELAPFVEILPICSARIFPALKSLHLTGQRIGDDLIGQLLGSSIVEGLEVLDLSQGSLTDGVVEELLASRMRLARLRRLDLSRNQFSEEGLAALRALPCPIEVGSRPRVCFDDGDHDGDYYDDDME
jgi:uncharacterized protein (TIGR02996 family)